MVVATSIAAVVNAGQRRSTAVNAGQRRPGDRKLKNGPLAYFRRSGHIRGIGFANWSFKSEERRFKDCTVETERFVRPPTGTILVVVLIYLFLNLILEIIMY